MILRKPNSSRLRWSGCQYSSVCFVDKVAVSFKYFDGVTNCCGIQYCEGLVLYKGQAIYLCRSRLRVISIIHDHLGQPDDAQFKTGLQPTRLTYGSITFRYSCHRQA